MDGSRKTMGLILLAVLALGLRVGAVLLLQADHAGPLAYEHGEIAENLLAGHGFSVEFLGTEGPTSQQAPFYPCLLAVVYFFFGSGTPAAMLAVQLLQCVAGTALVLAVAWLGWSLLPDRASVGWIAAIGAAVYPTHIYMVTHLQVALWAALLLTLWLAVVVSPRFRATRRGAILVGGLSGALLLIEPILALVLPVGAFAFWLAEGHTSWMGRFSRAAFGRVAWMIGIAAIVIAPWTVRNMIVHGQFVFVKSTFGYAFWQGNNPSSWGTDKIPKPSAQRLRQQHDGTPAGMDRAMWEARHETLYIDDVLLKPTGYRDLAGLSEPERSQLLGRRAWEYVRSEPGRYAGLCLQRLRYFLLFDETNPKAANRLYRFSTVTWLVLASIGLVISLRRWHELWPTYAIFAVVMLFHSLVIVSARFRIPVEPISFLWAATAVAPLAMRLLPQRGLRIYRPAEQPRDPFTPPQVFRHPNYDQDVPPRRKAG